MIDTIVNLFMIAGILIVSLPVMFFASVGIVHAIYGVYNLVLRKNNT